MTGITEKKIIEAETLAAPSSSVEELPKQVLASLAPKKPTDVTALPEEILLRVFQFAISEPSDATQPKTGVKTAAALSQTCRHWHAISNDNDISQVCAEALLMHVLHGNAKEVKRIVSANPRLLFVKVKKEVKELASGFEEIENEQGHIQLREIPITVKGLSPLQAMLRAGDIWMLKEIKPFIGAFREIAFAQFTEQFPHGVEYPPCEYDVNQVGIPFSRIIGAISSDTALRRDQNDREWDKTRRPTEATKTVLRKFRKDFMPGIFTTGHHFNLNNLLKAFELYVQCFDNWNWNQRSLFWCQVIGYLQRLVPAVVAQAFCQGLYYLLEQKQPLERGLELHSWVTNSRVSYFGDSGHAGLGFDFGIYRGALCRAWRYDGCGGVGGAVGLLKNYVEQTQQSLADLRSTWSNQSASNNMSCSPTRPQNGV